MVYRDFTESKKTEEDVRKILQQIPLNASTDMVESNVKILFIWLLCITALTILILIKFGNDILR